MNKDELQRKVEALKKKNEQIDQNTQDIKDLQDAILELAEIIGGTE